MRTTVSCTDADSIPKVEGAGEVIVVDGETVQVMHNGLLVSEGGYGGSWMTEIIRSLEGHHEPQQELVFDTIIRRLADDTPSPTMVEFGSHWTYYGLWFLSSLATGRLIGLEPDPLYLAIGKGNAERNGLSDRVTFEHGAIGNEPGEMIAFEAESDGAVVSVAQYDLDSLMAENEIDHVDLVLADVQGAESVLVRRADPSLRAGRVRFLVVSTHHHSISGDPLTHQRMVDLIVNAGGHIIAEHSITESFSGDGLVAASFDERDVDLRVPISYARAKDSLFGDLEFDLARLEGELAGVQLERDAILKSRAWRWSAPLRTILGSLRRAVRPQA